MGDHEAPDAEDVRGPGLVGYPPSGLRWSGDSRDLFFEWRKPGEKEGATYVLSQNTTTPRRLIDEERKLVPPVGGAWDEAHRRVLFADEGDIVVLDTVARTRHQVTRTTAPETGPRWARNDTARLARDYQRWLQVVRKRQVGSLRCSLNSVIKGCPLAAQVIIVSRWNGNACVLL